MQERLLVIGVSFKDERRLNRPVPEVILGSLSQEVGSCRRFDELGKAQFRPIRLGRLPCRPLEANDPQPHRLASTKTAFQCDTPSLGANSAQPGQPAEVSIKFQVEQSS